MRLASAPLSTALANLIARLTASHTSASFLVPKSSTAVPVLMTDQTKPSPELLAVVRRWLEAMRTRQADSYIHLFSSTENLRYIGTDADEVWGGEVFRNGFIDHVNEIPDWWFEETRAEAFERGEVGWAFLEGKILVDGAQKPMIARYTLVCAIEQGAWKLVQAHTSLPASNIETHGFEHHAMNALLAEVAKGFDLAQREGVATIVFTDVVGSSALAAATGDRDWAKRIAGHFEAMGEIVEAAGGQMVKSLGDGTMSSFSSTVAALSASRRMQAQTSEDTLSPPLKLRIGMHRGDVIQTADDFFGTVVNKAARVAGVAEAGEIRVSDEVRLAALDDAESSFSSPRVVVLKGFEGEELTHVLDWGRKEG